ncbi:hypothetical protein DespoDRAFT_03746 [Desulfobacter postgatei 2ac9]|uniref:Uncharacterized protein n=1 Tax=Desulfobacter postgatei 2ac9 TaxID=879212 RepID=I5B7L8_9BACT|nr:hypothetical protein DespoDRAFT_03746 [Desulfobacter postgatei 2ac9]
MAKKPCKTKSNPVRDTLSQDNSGLSQYGLVRGIQIEAMERQANRRLYRKKPVNGVNRSK